MQIGKARQVWQLEFAGEWPTSVAFLGDSRHLAAGNRQGDIRVWQLPEPPVPVEGGKSETAPDTPPAGQLKGHDNGITHLLATPDGRTLISASLDRTVRLWDPRADADGAKQVLAGHRDWVQALGISGDGRRLISGDDSCLTIVWDLATGAELTRWTGYDRVWVTAAALSPDGSRAFTAEYADGRGSFDRPAAQARFWNATDSSLQQDLLKVWLPDIKDQDRGDTYGYAQAWGKLFGRGLVCAAFSPDGSLLAVGQGGETGTGKVHLVDVASGQIARTVSGHQYGVCDLCFSADGKYILSCGRDTMVRICQVSDGQEVLTLGKSRGGQFKDWLHALAVSPDQQWVAAADIAGLVHVWQLES
ncbi:MAG: hypothetical protein J5I93_20770 [Pirellulaceae bacterium]|nr:hypothetical protein [Pirellulaceae bacterium]